MVAVRIDEPNYRVMARDLRALILQGAYADGQPLPTEARLATEYSVSRQTVRRAFQDLVSEGMVYRVRGKGTFAQSNADGYVRQVGSVDDLMGLSDDTAMEVTHPLSRRIDPAGAGRLRLTSDVVYELRFVRIHDGVRFCATRVHLPPHVAKLLDDVEELQRVGSVSTLTVIGLLDERLARPIAEANQSITVETLDAVDGAALSASVGLAALRVDRVYLDTHGDAVELATSHFLPEHYSYRINLRRNRQ